jgi:RNA 3'-phosphate cyclase
MRFIEIDGSFGEGGGQIIRTAVGLSGATGVPIKVYNIRAGRPKPGLSYQHMNAIKAVQLLTDAQVYGLELGSKKLSFTPSRIKSGGYRINIGTAGSVSLVLQAFLIPAILCKDELQIEVTGGTDVPMSPPIDYIKNVFLKFLSRLGADVRIGLKRRGHYPKGGGSVIVKVRPSSLSGISVKRRGRLNGIQGVSHCTSLPEHVAERQRDSALHLLREELGQEAEIVTEITRDFGQGSGIVLWAEYENTVLGASSLGKRGKRAERVGREAASALLSEIKSQATVDFHMGDQLIPYIAMAEDTSSYVCRLTSHTKTNIYTTERILKTRFDIAPAAEGLVRISCQKP